MESLPPTEPSTTNGSETANQAAPERAGGRIRQSVRHGVDVGKDKYASSSAEYFFRRLGSVDFMNQAMIFAGTLLLCAFPFLIVMTALAGRDASQGVARHLGLDQSAAEAVGHLFTSSNATTTSVTGAAWVFFVLSGVSVATSLQGLYQRIFRLDGHWARDLPRALIWLAFAAGWILLSGWVGPWVRSGSPVVFAVVGLVAFTTFWWFTMWLLLARRIPWRQLFAPALATGLCWVGMEAVFAVVFSGMIVSNDREYGPIGIVFSLMSWLIAIGVVVVLGAVIGLVWQERGFSLSRVLRRPAGRT